MATRLLLADDADLLLPVRHALASRPEMEVVVPRTTPEALELLATSPVLALLAGGSVDPLAVLQARDAQGLAVPVVVVLPEGAERDPVVLAGADEVLFAPVTPADVAVLLDAREGTLPFRNAPRVAVPMQVNLQTAAGTLITAQVQQLSREAMLLSLPEGTAPVPPGALLRTVFTLFEGGTLTVWARTVDAGAPVRFVIRFVGLSRAEIDALDYFVQFYRQSAVPSSGTQDASQGSPLAPTGEDEDQTRTTPTRTTSPDAPAVAAPAVASTGIVPPPAAEEPAPRPDEFQGDNETLMTAAKTSLDELATFGGLVSGGKSAKTPDGFSGARMRQAVARLAPAEASALRGTTMYNEMILELRRSAGMKLVLAEMTGQLKGGGAPGLQKAAARNTIEATIEAAERIHEALLVHIERKIKAGDPRAMRDLGPVQSGLVSAINELRTTFDREVMGVAPAAPAAAPSSASVGHARYQKTERAPTSSGTPAPAANAPEASRRSRRPLAVVFVLVLAGLALWSNLHYFRPRPTPEFVAPSVEFTVGPARVWMTDPRADVHRFIVDGSWNRLTPAEKDAALAEFAARARAGGVPAFEVIAHSGKQLERHQLDERAAAP